MNRTPPSLVPNRAWHFLAEGNKLRDGTIAPADGKWLEHKGKLVLCESHAANAYPKLVEALRWNLSLLEKPNGSHSRTYQVRYEHAAALLRDLGEAE